MEAGIPDPLQRVRLADVQCSDVGTPEAQSLLQVWVEEILVTSNLQNVHKQVGRARAAEAIGQPTKIDENSKDQTQLFQYLLQMNGETQNT